MGLIGNALSPGPVTYGDALTSEKYAESADTTLRNLLAQSLGAMGDVQPYIRGRFPFTMNLPPTRNSEQWADVVGGDPEHWSWNPAALIAPGPGEIKGAVAGVTKLLPESSLAAALLHGSPHSRFAKVPKGAKTDNIQDLFDMSKIGTGEGTQAFGHGLYFAESPGVAKSYQNTVQAFDRTTAEGAARAAMFDARGNKTQAIKYLEENNAKLYGENRFDAVDLIKQDKVPDSGHLYEVDIPDEVTAKMLDWDKPLSEQPFIIKKPKEEIIAKVRAEGRQPTLIEQVSVNLQNSGSAENTMGWTGKQWYKNVAQKAGGEEAASRALNEAGIPGIRFLDRQSRYIRKKHEVTLPNDHPMFSPERIYFDTKDEAIKAAADKGGKYTGTIGTRNIVLFDENLITKVKRDGEVVFEK